MHHVIHLNLGSEAEDQIRSVWRSLADQDICSREIVSGGRPHVTVMSSAPFSVPDLREDFVSLANAVGPLEITFSHLGVFPASVPVLFLGVTHTVALMSLHRRFFDLISSVAEVFDFARPDHFVFHCTLGHVLRPQNLPRAVALVCAARLPARTVANSFDVVECGTVKHPECFTFSAGNTMPNKPAAPNPQ